MKNISFLSDLFSSFLEVKFSIYLNRRVFVMRLALLSNRPVGALVGIARPVVNSVGLSFKMAPEGVLEFTCLEKVSIYCNILF